MDSWWEEASVKFVACGNGHGIPVQMCLPVGLALSMSRRTRTAVISNNSAFV
ncbi:hypothetical protein M438DRAFT_347233 [Aureobasidium pullulans EXF-150]|uniref:Uncharacterized protein n=1 Tax=Aureobasidium pullulans EXF-150 TaxID=1043002 RepID=A0A074XFE1_AURPU|nr:uncharacterized protein M438DRAFT_347233 [Aureobasidium pullulans EXF-150]KEQ82459.1 hypothetical protein M438DRAFT_347233 [Aureobasidium pullulans EXF-150]